jgi:hypothetical protein
MSKQFIWVTSRKLSSLMPLFRIQCFWGGHGKISWKTWFIQEGAICPELLIQPPVEFSTVVTCKSLTFWSHLMGHRRAEKVIYQNGIRDFWSFSQFEAWNWRSVLLQFCPETEFSSDVDRQNSVTSKPFSGQGHMSNGWQAGRVSQVFSVNSETESFGNSSVLAFYLLMFAFIQISVFTFLSCLLWG